MNILAYWCCDMIFSGTDRGREKDEETGKRTIEEETIEETA